MHDAMFDAPHCGVEQDAHHAENHEGCEHAGHVRHRLRLRNRHAHALLRAQKPAAALLSVLHSGR